MLAMLMQGHAFPNFSSNATEPTCDTMRGIPFEFLWRSPLSAKERSKQSLRQLFVLHVFRNALFDLSCFCLSLRWCMLFSPCVGCERAAKNTCTRCMAIYSICLHIYIYGSMFVPMLCRDKVVYKVAVRLV